MKERLEADIRLLEKMREFNTFPEYQALLEDEINYLICVLRLKDEKVEYEELT